MSEVIQLCDHGQMVKLCVRFFYISNIIGVHFETNETLTKFLLSSKDEDLSFRHQLVLSCVDPAVWRHSACFV